MSRRIVSMCLVILLMGVTLIGCQPAPTESAPAPTQAPQQETAPSETAPPKAETAPEKEEGAKNTIAFANLYYGSYFFFVEVESVKRGVEALGYNFVTVNANVDAAVQASQYESYIAQGVKAIVCDAVDSDAIVDLVNKAHDAGIYTAFIDTCASGGNVDVSVSFNNYNAGKLAGERIIEGLIAKYGEAKGTVLDLHGRMSSNACRERSEGFHDVISNYPGVTYLEALSEADDNAHDAVDNMLAVHEDIDAIFVYSDGHLYGTIEALKKRDRWVPIGEANHTIIVSCDGAYDTLDHIRNGYVEATVAQDSSCFGQIACEMLSKYSFNGEKVPLGPYTNKNYYWETCEVIDSASGPLVSIPAYLIDPSNVDDPRHWANIGVKEWGLSPNM